MSITVDFMLEDEAAYFATKMWFIAEFARKAGKWIVLQAWPYRVETILDEKADVVIRNDDIPYPLGHEQAYARWLQQQLDDDSTAWVKLWTWDRHTGGTNRRTVRLIELLDEVRADDGARGADNAADEMFDLQRECYESPTFRRELCTLGASEVR